MLATRSWLLAAADSSPAALRAALAIHARRVGEAGRAEALALRRMVDLRAPDPKVERLDVLLLDRRPTLIVTQFSATVLYLRDRLAHLLPAWSTGRLAGWGRIAVPQERVLAWFAAGAPDVTPRILITRTQIDPAELGRVERVVQYDDDRAISTGA